MQQKQKALSVVLDAETQMRFEKYWRDANFPNKSEALRALINAGLSVMDNNHPKKQLKFPPSEKQISYVKSICRRKQLPPPAEWTAIAYSKFIEENK